MSFARRPYHLTALAFFVAGAMSTGCAEEPIHDPSDLDPVQTDGKADGPFSNFDRTRLVSDQAFYDSSVMSADEVQQFFVETPYAGRRSFLADLRIPSGELVSTALVRVARDAGLNPIVLLATLQKEAGLISRTVRPSSHRVDFAFGCGCSDGQSCSSAFRGLDKQLECAADRIAEYTADLATNGKTISGWGVGVTKKTLEKAPVAPANRATAVLYTYTPWVLPNTGGNWLFWNIWRRYAVALDYDEGLRFPFNAGFIGGNCTEDADCLYEGGRCLFAEDGAGTCSSSCESSCPDRAGAFATTFCAGGDAEGFCLAECDTALSATGCAERQVCEVRTRRGDPNTTRSVCVPEG